MSLLKELRSRDNKHSSFNDVVVAFVRKTGEPMITNLIAEVNHAVQETSPALSVYVFNPDAVPRDVKSQTDLFKTLMYHYGEAKIDH